jgi:hypothetical protein
MSAVDRPARMGRVASVGVSTAEICGVRDHGALLAPALRREGYDCSAHWLERDGESLRAGRAQMGEWTHRLPAELAAAQADAALLHYSVFAYSFRGLPLFVHPVFAAVRRAKLPLVTILHEFVYPWRRDGLRGTAWAVSQRALLIDVMRLSTALVTTTDFQAEWLSSRRWLPKRPVAVAPVFSNLPPPAAPRRANHDGATIGLFGYAYGSATCSLVTGAMRMLQDRGNHARLRLLGAPGQASATGREWAAAARAAGLSQMPSFSGTLAPQQLSDELAACDLLLFADPLGPNSRKTTLAASLASGRPVVAVDGPRPFGGLVEAHACEIVTPRAHDLADALARLLEDEAAREALGARGLGFAKQSTSAASAAHVIADLLDLARDRG